MSTRSGSVPEHTVAQAAVNPARGRIRPAPSRLRRQVLTRSDARYLILYWPGGRQRG
ncbi:MAG TPA: hypothetical protein VNI34_05150 [Candidatus Nitrosotalea sp.]|nr:hypothetical protein [Candidatus Nitrosotalea sp.]